jgi:hypothetical protein
VEVTLHRAIIRFDSPSLPPDLRAITRSAAKMRFTSAIELVNKLEPVHLQSFWYFASKVNLAIIGTFGSLLWATSDSLDEAEFYRSQLAEYRWTLRVSSKAAEFMKFTVGMLDASAVFLKDGKGESKGGTPTMIRDQQVPQSPAKPEAIKADIEQTIHESLYNQNYIPTNEVSPSVGASTENAYPYEAEYASADITMAPDMRPPWTGFDSFTPGDVQDWSLDQLYNFDNMQSIEDILGNRRIVEEYDESGNIFAGF